MNSLVHGRRSPALHCVQLVPNWSALRTPLLTAGGSGARQRNLPTGGATNGMPLKETIPPSAAPSRAPLFVLTWSWALAAARNAKSTMNNVDALFPDFGTRIFWASTFSSADLGTGIHPRVFLASALSQELMLSHIGSRSDKSPSRVVQPGSQPSHETGPPTN